MAEQSAGTHEPFEMLRAETLELHRAIVSLMEELEAIDWYQQRVDATADEALKKVLEHNRDEEIEHAAMVLEWIRRRNPVFDRMLRTYLFTTREITEIEVEETAGESAGGGTAEAAAVPTGFTVGSLK